MQNYMHAKPLLIRKRGRAHRRQISRRATAAAILAARTHTHTHTLTLVYMWHVMYKIRAFAFVALVCGGGQRAREVSCMSNLRLLNFSSRCAQFSIL